MATLQAGVEVARPQQIDFEGFEIEAGDTVVDVGCGHGAVCLYAASRGAEAIGLDVEPDLIAYSERLIADAGYGGFRGIVVDGGKMPLADGVASVVVATEVLEHVDDPAAFLAELARIGQPGARYLISVPDPASEGVIRHVAPAWYWEPPLHIHVYEHAQLDGLIADAGLVIESRRSSGFYWSMRWICRLAIGMEHKFAPSPPHAIFDHLDGLMAELLATPGGWGVLKALDRLVPKSQVLIARKPGAVAKAAKAPISRRIRRFLRDGSLKLGGFDVRWHVRRSA